MKTVSDGAGFPPKVPALKPYLVRNIFTDFKRHDLGPNFYERNYDGTLRTQIMTPALWGVGNPQRHTVTMAGASI